MSNNSKLQVSPSCYLTVHFTTNLSQSVHQEVTLLKIAYRHIIGFSLARVCNGDNWFAHFPGKIITDVLQNIKRWGLSGSFFFSFGGNPEFISKERLDIF